MCRLAVPVAMTSSSAISLFDNPAVINSAPPARVRSQVRSRVVLEGVAWGGVSVHSPGVDPQNPGHRPGQAEALPQPVILHPEGRADNSEEQRFVAPESEQGTRYRDHGFVIFGKCHHLPCDNLRQGLNLRADIVADVSWTW